VPQRDGPIRVGVVSQYFRKHSVWDAILKGWFQALDRSRFSLHAFYTGGAEDEETRYARAHAASFSAGPPELDRWVETILSHALDVLIYPEVGMDPLTVQLASLRLARVQVASWGHPETTGLPTIDYYLSAECLEPAESQGNYTERLVTLPGIGCYYVRPQVVPRVPDFHAWGIPADAALYVCPGVPFKYTPAYDAILTAIAQRVGSCRFIFFSHTLGYLTEQLENRIARTFEAAGLRFTEHVTFIPWQDSAGFYGILENAHVFLDTIGFSGFNTAMQAVQCGIPIVTREGAFMRGRLASGILKRMGLTELVMGTNDAYVDLAVRLGTDVDYRNDVRRRIVESRNVLFEDAEPIRALEDFLARAVAEA
jgi:predicted O-linked N-acetylglucosamine transferase (SPINDLY family)